MAYLLPLLGYAGLTLSFLFLTLSIASGLYYLSELVEEHSVLSSRLLRRLIYIIMATQTLLCLIDGFPWHLTLLGVFSHAVYMSNLRHFPIVKLSDPLFLASCVLVLGNHWAWFRWFSEPQFNAGYGRGSGGERWRDRYSTPAYREQPSFTEIASYFGLCVWLVPFALFVSLSAGENVLPSMGSEYATGQREGVGGVGSVGVTGEAGFKKGHKRRNTGMAKAAVNSTREWISENGAVMGLWRHENVKSF
jgi:hypothetical protein